MRWLGLAAAVAALTAIAEIVVFVLVADAIGLGWALLAVLVSTLVGGWLLRREGVRGWRRFRAALAEGRPPGAEASDGLLGLVGALLLIVPGLITSVAGLALLTPPGRTLVGHSVRRATERRVSSAVAGGVFGPRRVRAYRGPSSPNTDPTSPPSADAARPMINKASVEGGVVEGDIIEPDGRP